MAKIGSSLTSLPDPHPVLTNECEDKGTNWPLGPDSEELSFIIARKNNDPLYEFVLKNAQGMPKRTR